MSTRKPSETQFSFITTRGSNPKWLTEKTFVAGLLILAVGLPVLLGGGVEFDSALYTCTNFPRYAACPIPSSDNQLQYYLGFSLLLVGSITMLLGVAMVFLGRMRKAAAP